MSQVVRLTRKEKRIARQRGNVEEMAPRQNQNTSLKIREINPLTLNQKKVFQSFDNNQNLLLAGIAGSGKSFISLYLSLQEVLSGCSDHERVVIVRSVVPTRDMGFLPGSAKDKAKVYEAPYQRICAEIFGRGDAYDVLKNKNTVEFITTSFVRGTTIDDAIVLIDEFQNMDSGELHSVITRVGKNSRVIICGDGKQDDLTSYKEQSGCRDFMTIIHRMRSFDVIQFDVNDVVRSGLVKEYLLARDELENTGKIERV